jgi:hypothetical protein
MTSLSMRGFSETGQWYKGNLHCHTTNSDGCLTPAEAVELFRSHGYHFLCLSDHDLYSDYRPSFNRGDFILLPGLEASAVLYESSTGLRKKVHHLHGILGTEEMQAQASHALFHHKETFPVARYYDIWDGAKVAQQLADALSARGMFVTYNHPVWSRVEEAEFLPIKGLWALEIYNYGMVNESYTGYDELHWDSFLRQGRHLFAFAADDNHNEGTFPDALGGYIMVKSPELSHEALVQNLLCGNFYASSGPQIFDWGIREGVAYVDCSPVCRIDFIAGNYINDGCSCLSPSPSHTLTHGEYRLKGHESYVRVRCSDLFGHTAWSNPLFLS